MEYILCCDKQITFENGDVWDNPDYDKWMETYRGRAVDTDVLQAYYPRGLSGSSCSD